MQSNTNDRYSAILAVWMLHCCAAQAPAAENWLQFRGNDSNTAVDERKLPDTWSEGKNIAWKINLPGRGPSSPIVVGSRVFVTCSSGARQDRLRVLAFNVNDGQEVWQRQFWATGRTLTHSSIGVAAPTPASDGERIYAFYSSNDLACLDLEGNLKWYRGLTREYPRAANDVGMASSPLVVNGAVIVQIENQGDSFAMGLDAKSGETLWRQERVKFPCWSSPVVMRGEQADQDLVLLQSSDKLSAHRPRTGEVVWSYPAKCNGIPSTVAAGGTVYVPAEGMTALRPSGSSSEPRLLWSSGQLQPGSASPLFADGKLYIVNRAGVLTCAEASTGDVLWRQRLKGSFWATPVMVGKRIYCLAEEGNCQVVQVADDGKSATVLSQAEFGEKLQGSPAVAGNALYVRGDEHLWKIANTPE